MSWKSTKNTGYWKQDTSKLNNFSFSKIVCIDQFSILRLLSQTWIFYLVFFVHCTKLMRYVDVYNKNGFGTMWACRRYLSRLWQFVSQPDRLLSFPQESWQLLLLRAFGSACVDFGVRKSSRQCLRGCKSVRLRHAMWRGLRQRWSRGRDTHNGPVSQRL